MPETTPRPILHLRSVAERYPDAWRHLEHARTERGRALPAWPDWCYCPLAGAYAIVSGGGANRVPVERLADVAIVGALGAWRATQGIYRFDPTLLAALHDTPTDGAIPTDVLQRLPEWCVYVETPGWPWNHDFTLQGYFAHLESDVTTGRVELRLVLDGAVAGSADLLLLPVPLHLGPVDDPWPLSRAVPAALEEAARQAAGRADPATMAEALTAARRELLGQLPRLLSTLLYLASDGADVRDRRDPARVPARPEPQRTKRGLRLFAAGRITQWEVGVRIGAALRRAQDAAGDHEPGAGTHARPRLHIRRAHWHTFLAGPRDRARERRIKWLPPIAVNLEGGDELPAVVRPVE